MPDREKVIRTLEEIKKQTAEIGLDSAVISHGFIDKIIAMLKEQEAVKPIKPLDKDDDYTFICSNCKGELFCGDILRDHFCPTCGRAVKWE